MKLSVKPSEAVIAVGMFVLGWQISAFMTLCAAGLYFLVKWSSKPEGGPAYEYSPYVESYPGRNIPMKNPKNELLMDIVVVLGVLGYFLSPIDALPDVIFPFGYIDDAAVIGAAVKYFTGKKKKLPPTPAPAPRQESTDGDVIDVECRRVS